MVNRPKPLLLRMLDGFGLRKNREHTEIARPPCGVSLQQNFPMTALNCLGNLDANKALLDSDFADSAPPMLIILGVKQPSEMTGRLLIDR